MSITLIESGDVCRMVFDGCLTFEHARELEDHVIHALRRFTSFELDLSEVEEIDLCGLHLLQVIFSICGTKAVLTAGSQILEQASQRLLPSRRGLSLRGSPDERRRGTESSRGAACM